MFKWIGRAKRIETKLDRVLEICDPQPQPAGNKPYVPPTPRTDPILMTDEREERIRKDLENEG
jgi:hypothetical protein